MGDIDLALAREQL